MIYQEEELFTVINERKIMKVKPSVKARCEKCKIIVRRGKIRILCENPKHKQVQG